MTEGGEVWKRFKARDAQSYDDRTEAFDRFTEMLTRPLAERLIALAALAPGEQVLDVGSGTGIVTLAAARAVAAGGRVLGIDLSEGMLRFAVGEAARAGLAGALELRRMDAETLDLGDQSFDVVLSLFSLLHFPDPMRALSEMRRVLRAGGRLIAGIGGPPPLASRHGLRQALRHIADRARRAQGKMLVAPGFLDSLVERRLPHAQEREESELARHPHARAPALAGLLRRAGFEVTGRDWMGVRVGFDDAEEFWEAQRTFSSIARKRLGAASAPAVESVRAEFLDACRAVQSRGGALVYPVAACYVTARR